MNEEIKVGQGATFGIGSDRYPYTVVEVIHDEKVVVQADDYRRTDKNGISEMQTYEYTPNPDACKITVTKRKDGFWRKVGDSNGGGRFSFKARNAYQDPSF